MSPPVLVTAPAQPPVGLVDLKAHLQVSHSERDDMIASLQLAAVAMLDGWRGQLGRAIMPQTWQQDFDGWGCLRLAMPDVTSAAVVDVVDGVPGPEISAELQRDRGGWFIVAPPGAGTPRVTYECALPPELLPAAQAAIKMLVAHWYLNREAVSAGAMQQVPMAADALIGTLRWRRI